MKQQKTGISWWVIFLVMYLFFPAGIMMLLDKLNREPHRMIDNGKVLKYLSVFWFILAPACAAMASTGQMKFEDGSNAWLLGVLTAVTAVVLGVITLFLGIQLTQRGYRYSDHIALFARQQVLELDGVAADLKLPYKKVAKDLQYMIDAGALTNCWIDQIHRRLVLKPTKKPTRAVTCRSCGAKNTAVIGETTACEYCGSEL